MASISITDPELFYVNSKITDPDGLSQDTFAHWYDDIHIPDIFLTSGIKHAFRYAALEDEFKTVDRPYLALYPVKFEGYLQSAEFAAIPVQSDVLPGPNHIVSDVANFDTRCYKNQSAKNPFAGPYVLTVQYDGDRPGIEKLLETEASCMSLMCYLSHQTGLPPEKNEIGIPPQSLAIFWYQTLEELTNASNASTKEGKVFRYKLLRRQDAES